MSAKAILLLVALIASVILWCLPQSMLNAGLVNVNHYGLFEYVTVFTLPGDNSDYSIDEEKLSLTAAVTVGVWLPYALVYLDNRKRR